MYYVSLVRCPQTLRHICLEHTALATTDVNCWICRAALSLLSARRGAKAPRPYKTYMEPAIQDTLSFIAAFMQLYADI